MIKKIFKVLLVLFIAGFFVAQFIRPDFTNPPVVEADTLWGTTEVPDNVKQVIVRSCGDCHSNETQYPWYSYITPSNWFLADHIDEGRDELNFSTWRSYKPESQKKKLNEICEQVEEGAMPLPSYLWIHRDAVLTQSDAKLLCDWANAEIKKIDGTGIPVD